MAKTPYGKLGSEEILSAHLNGIQRSVNNLEEVLNMKTASKTGMALTPYVDMVDKSARYRIYEGLDSNWLYSPAPIVKRNSILVDPAEYELQAEYGVVIFHVQQNANDAITADYTHIVNQSTRIEDVESRIATLEQGGGSSNSLLNDLVKHYPGTYRSHGISPQNTVSSVLVLPNSMDLFPFKAYESIICDMMGAQVATAATGALTTFAIYTDSNGYPGTLTAQTGTVDCSTVGWKEVVFSSGNITLNPGNYWIARFANSGIAYHGLGPSGIYPVPSAPPIGTATINNSSGLGAGVGGIRYGSTFGTTGTFPTTFPVIGSGPQYLERNAYASPWVRRKP